MKNPEELPYRPCVGVMLVNDRGMAFVGKRIDTKEGDWWQMPQGGMDDGEDVLTAGAARTARGNRRHRPELRRCSPIAGKSCSTICPRSWSEICGAANIAANASIGC